MTCTFTEHFEYRSLCYSSYVFPIGNVEVCLRNGLFTVTQTISNGIFVYRLFVSHQRLLNYFASSLGHALSSALYVSWNLLFYGRAEKENKTQHQGSPGFTIPEPCHHIVLWYCCWCPLIDYHLISRAFVDVPPRPAVRFSSIVPSDFVESPFQPLVPLVPPDSHRSCLSTYLIGPFTVVFLPAVLLRTLTANQKRISFLLPLVICSAQYRGSIFTPLFIVYRLLLLQLVRCTY